MTKLFVSAQRKQLLRRLLDDIGLAVMPEFVRPAWLVKLLIGFSMCAGVITAIILFRIPSSPHLTTNFLIASPILSGIFVAVFVGWVAVRLTRGMRYDFKPSMATVGDFSRWIVAHGPNVVGAPPGQWSREQVSLKVREIVIDVLGCEKDYREEANFVKDLGLS